MATTPTRRGPDDDAKPERSRFPGLGRRQPPPDDQPGWRVEGGGAPKPPSRQGPRVSYWIFPLILVLLVLNYYVAHQVSGTNNPRKTISYSPQFKDAVSQGKVKSVTFTGDAIQGDFTGAVTVDGKSYKRFSTRVPPTPGDPQLVPELEKQNVEINARPADTGPSTLATILINVGPTLLFLAFFIFLFRAASRMGGGGGPLAAFGRSRARRYEGAAAPEQRVTFDDVAGIDEAKHELTEIVDFLRNPDKYRRLGGRIPRGVLLSGPPGTGKTLLARAVAGEANVPFFSLSASEFIEMIVGVGASRVRDLFAQAKAAAPAIIFIDELDAIGRSRSSGASGFGGADEREQTLNQILTEMDGFDPTTGVIVLGATNRPDVLDQALLRPGRFDRRVTVQPPDKRGRELILRVHTRSVPLAPDVDLGAIAATTPGMVGADLANLVNEAALLAARREHRRVERSDFADAVEKILLGAERNVMMTEADRRHTAVHESGHALVNMLTPGADPVRKVSIIPRGMALGVTFSAPTADRFNYDEAYLMGRIKGALGGRVAEELVYGTITTGAESDIQQLTEIARRMVGRWGMSRELGPIALMPSEPQSPLLPGAQETSERTQERVDDEVRRIVDEAYADVTQLLSENRDKLDALTDALLEAETLDEPEAYAAAGVTRPSPDEEEALRGGTVVAPAAE
jgi:cell division protease FtsH